MLFFPPITVLVVSAIFAAVLLNSSLPSYLAQVYIEPPHGESTDLRLSSLFTPEVNYWESEIINWSGKWNLDPNLIATVMQIESCGDPLAKSGAGAMGLFQVMPYHFISGEEPYDPQTNATRGLSYLSQAMAAGGGDPRLAMAGYNGGISNAAKIENLWSAETVRYVSWGHNIYSDTLRGFPHSETLDEWLNSGGINLCAQARQRLGL